MTFFLLFVRMVQCHNKEEIERDAGLLLMTTVYCCLEMTTNARTHVLTHSLDQSSCDTAEKANDRKEFSTVNTFFYATSVFVSQETQGKQNQCRAFPLGTHSMYDYTRFV